MLALRLVPPRVAVASSPPLVLRTLSTSAALHRQQPAPRARRGTPPPPHSRYSQRPPRHGPPQGRRAAGPSHISRDALASRLEHHLRTAWKPQSKELRALAHDLGVSHPNLVDLARQWTLVAQRHLATTTSSSPASSSSGAATWDLDALQTAYVNDGQDALWDASLATFLAWVRAAVPLPTPSSTSPVPDSTLSQLHQLADLADRRYHYEGFPSARQHRRRLILHVGPTNSGKTHSALVALARARTGAYAGPLRLLAHEVFARFNEGKIGNEGKRTCNLVTGEEQRILDPDAGLQSCTVEMFPLAKHLEVGVVDEIQMIGDPQRGTAWTAAVVGARCDELHLCGEESVVDLVRQIAAEVGDECVVKRYQRLSPLVVASQSLEGDLSRIRRGDCLVTFSRSNIFAFKRAIEEKTGLRVAVAYGGLPPEVREEQARAFNEGVYDVLVASDAIGMGLNLCVLTLSLSLSLSAPDRAASTDALAPSPLISPPAERSAASCSRRCTSSTARPRSACPCRRSSRSPAAPAASAYTRPCRPRRPTSTSTRRRRPLRASASPARRRRSTPSTSSSCRTPWRSRQSK